MVNLVFLKYGYMQTLKQYITQVYGSVRYRAKRRGDKYPKFTKLELLGWMLNNGLDIMWNQYIKSNFNKNLKPSIDRINDYKGYSFDNMQLITWKENNLKGVNGEKHHRACHNRQNKKTVYQYDKELNLIATHKSINDCAKNIGVHPVSISRALTGERKTIKKYILKYFALTNSELTIKK